MRKLSTARLSLAFSAGHAAALAVARTRYSLPPYTVIPTSSTAEPNLPAVPPPTLVSTSYVCAASFPRRRRRCGASLPDALLPRRGVGAERGDRVERASVRDGGDAGARVGDEHRERRRLVEGVLERRVDADDARGCDVGQRAPPARPVQRVRAPEGAGAGAHEPVPPGGVERGVVVPGGVSTSARTAGAGRRPSANAPGRPSAKERRDEDDGEDRERARTRPRARRNARGREVDRARRSTATSPSEREAARATDDDIATRDGVSGQDRQRRSLFLTSVCRV